MISMSRAQNRAATSRGMPPADPAVRTAVDAAAIFAALLAPTLLAAAFDERQLNGVDVWLKPLRFQLALGLHFATLAALLHLLRPAERARAVVRWPIVAAAGMAMAEIGYIMIQAARGRGSHFNVSTPIEAVAYPLMGLGAVTIVLGSFVLGVVILRRGRAEAGPGLRLGAGLGLVIGSAATLIVAGTMSAGLIDGLGHWVGGPHDDTNGLPLVGWSSTGGDLRVPHFFATHAMQALPLAGWLADRRLEARATRAVWVATALWAALVIATFAQATMGLPVLRM